MMAWVGVDAGDGWKTLENLKIEMMGVEEILDMG